MTERMSDEEFSDLILATGPLFREAKRERETAIEAERKVKELEAENADLKNLLDKSATRFLKLGVKHGEEIQRLKARIQELES